MSRVICFFFNPIFIRKCQKIKSVTFFDSQDEINARENLYRYKCTNTWKIFSESEYLEALFDDRSANKDGKLLNILQAFANKGKLVSWWMSYFEIEWYNLSTIDIFHDYECIFICMLDIEYWINSLIQEIFKTDIEDLTFQF